jgi:hypothetical protein
VCIVSFAFGEPNWTIEVSASSSFLAWFIIHNEPAIGGHYLFNI